VFRVRSACLITVLALILSGWASARDISGVVVTDKNERVASANVVAQSASGQRFESQ
jgi:hypothetical protein